VPVRWWLVDHADIGRKELIYSEWTQSSHSFASATLRTMATAVKHKLMPLDSYKWLHRDARLAPMGKKVFRGWAHTESWRILSMLRSKRPGKTNPVRYGFNLRINHMKRYIEKERPPLPAA
jgi:hypothetical protein